MDVQCKCTCVPAICFVYVGLKVVPLLRLGFGLSSNGKWPLGNLAALQR